MRSAIHRDQQCHLAQLKTKSSKILINKHVQINKTINPMYA